MNTLSNLIIYEVPCQPNGYDCGVFLCQYARSIISIKENEFAAPNNIFSNPHKRTQVVKRWITDDERFKFNQDEITKLRQEMFDLIMKK